MVIYELLSNNLGKTFEYLDKHQISYIHVIAGVAGAYVVGLCAYLLFFAPLSKLPGSLMSKLTLNKIRLEAATGRFADVAEEEYYKYGDVYRVGPNAVAICNPTDCRSVLGTHRYIKSELYQRFSLIDDTMFTTQSPDLTHIRRRQVGPAFTHGYIGEMEPTIIEYGIMSIKKKWDSLISESPSGEVTIPYASHLYMTTFDVIGKIGYSQDFNALQNDHAQIVDWVANYNKLAIVRVLYNNAHTFPATLLTGHLVKSKNEFVAFGNMAAEKRRAQLRDNKGMEKPRDILQALIDGEDPDSKVKMTPTQITAENIGFLIGGTDTTSLTLTWTLHYLMLYPECYNKAVDEVRSTFAPDHIITYAEGKAQLPYIDACIHESMRIRAVSGVTLPRLAPEGGVTIQGHFLPAGTQIGVNIAGANHHQGTWKNPRRFWPERFIENEKLKQNVMTFSSGVRICPGRNLAQYEMMTILSNILKDYDFALPANSLFTPNRLDKYGNPVVMPRTHSLTVGPKYPDRDCKILIRKAP